MGHRKKQDCRSGKAVLQIHQNSLRAGFYFAGKQKTKNLLEDVINITTTRTEQQALQWFGPVGIQGTLAYLGAELSHTAHEKQVREDGMLTAKKTHDC